MSQTINSSILPVYNTKTAGSFLEKYYKQYKNFSPYLSTNSKIDKLESFSRVFIQDLIGEGPIYGLFDDLGNDLVLFNNGNDNEENLKGVYLNDVPIKNSRNNTLNYSNMQVVGQIGFEFQTALSTSYSDEMFQPWSAVGVVYSYDKPLYNLIVNNKASVINWESVYQNRLKTHSCYFTKKINNVITKIEDPTNGGNAENMNLDSFNDNVFEECFGVCHEIKDSNTDYLVITFKINSLYYIGGEGGMYYNKAHFGIQIGFRQDPDTNFYVYHVVAGIASSPYQFDVILNVKDFDRNAIPFIKIYNFSKATSLEEKPTNHIRSVSIVSVTEIIDKHFKYPNSAYYVVGLDSRGFGSIPVRSYNLKLLQIKVPENYDSNAKTYTGFWSGEFDPVLRWTDNPAWILYDLITNYRYGVGKFDFSDSVVDKWSIYQIAKYCDELVPTFNNTKYSLLTVSQLAPINYGKNWIILTGTDISESYFKKGELLSLVNLRFNILNDLGENEIQIKCFNKRIKNYTISVDKTSIVIELYNDFGLHKICSQFQEVKDFVKSKGDSIKTYNQAMVLLNNELINVNSKNIPNFKNYILSQDVFADEDINTYVSSSGLAGQQFENYLPILEPRFTANLFLSSETDIINLVNNLASIFKGLVYWSNNYLNFDNDRPKNSSYFFNNSNVKEGVFSYSGSSKDTRFTVAKIVYSDETDGYKDKTLYVEDQINIKKYGYVEKEIIGFGVTTKSQAKRLGEWFLVTNQIEQDLISFQAGPEVMLLNPGDIVNISDALKLSKRYGGRVVSVNDSNEIILDSKYDFIKVNDSISFIVPSKSKSVQDLNNQSQNSLVTDAEISQLSTTYIYTFKIESVGLDGNFRTKLLLKTTGTSDDEKAQENFYSISPSSLWIYEKSATNTTSSFYQQYRIVGIKENSPVEYEVTAVEYVKSKFNYIDNRDNLSANTIYSSDPNNQTITIPQDLLVGINADQLRSDDGIISTDAEPFTFASKYDYIMCGFDFTDSQIDTLFSVNTINVIKIKDLYTGTKPLKGLLIEYVLNSKKLSIKWNLTSQTTYRIVVPNMESKNTFEFIRAYALGENDSFI